MFMLAQHRPRFAAKAAAQRIGRMGEVEDCIARCRRAIAGWIVRSRQRRALRKIAEHNDDFRHSWERALTAYLASANTIARPPNRVTK